MAFSDYKTYEAVQAKYPQIVVQSGDIIPADLLEIKKLDTFLIEDIKFNLKTYRSNEYFASEALVSPVLRYVWKKHSQEINFWTHQPIKYDNDLSGTPDFMFTHLDREQYKLMSYPIITSVEAKSENFTEGWSQCITQMLACQKINVKPITVFGMVTTGKLWEFGKMEGDVVTQHPTAFGIENLPKLISILDYLLVEAKKQL